MSQLNIGENIAYLRKQQKLTQRELAELSGVNYTQLAKIEKGANSPSIELVLKILAPLGYYIQLKKASPNEYLKP